MGVVADGNFLQIVLGSGKAKKVTDICIEELGLPSGGVGNWQENKKTLKEGQKQSGFKSEIHTIAEIFIPLIPENSSVSVF